MRLLLRGLSMKSFPAIGYFPQPPLHHPHQYPCYYSACRMISKSPKIRMMCLERQIRLQSEQMLKEWMNCEHDLDMTLTSFLNSEGCGDDKIIRTMGGK